MTLELHGISKRFGAVQALAGVDLRVDEGEVHAICGQNGAGKSTLFGVLSGVHVPDAGRMTLGGAAFSPRDVRDAERMGLAIIHQELALIGALTVAENLFLGREIRRRGRLDRDAMEVEAQAALRGFGASLDPSRPVSELSVGEAQLVEIARALMKRCRVLLLDEPTAALSRAETEALLERIRGLKRQGVTCIFVSHRLPEVFAISDRITVLRDGKTVGTFAAGATHEAEIVRAMVGRDIAAYYPRRRPPLGDVVLEVRDLSVDTRLERVSFSLRAGEVLGLSGLMGAGKTELLLHLFGAWGARTGGEVRLHGEALPPLTPEAAVARGIALVPEDRKRVGLFLQQDIGFHLALSALTRSPVYAPIDVASEGVRGAELMARLKIAASITTQVRTLSGGNQQKVVIGKSFAAGPQLFLLDEPTRGVDVGAKVEIYEWINEVTAMGHAVLLASSDLSEVIGMSDRVLVLSGGRVAREVAHDEADEALLFEAALPHG